MPTYEYKCGACEHVFEKFQSITAKPLRTCPECKKSRLQRLIGMGAGLIFKGSGFYITDYRSDSYKSSEKADPGTATAKTDSGAKKDSSAKTESPANSESSPKAATDAKPAAGKAESAPAKGRSK